MRITRFLGFGVLVLALDGACRSPRRPELDRGVLAGFDTLQDSMSRGARATEERFHAMALGDLITELERAAVRGREPFNSAAFREVVKRREAAETLLVSIRERSQREYFKLMALKRLDPERYAKLPPATGAAILTDALGRSEVFNGWGIPGFYWESSARAIIEYGPASVPYLEPLLKDTRPAPVWGSEEVRVYEEYRFRVCDYALALLGAIRQGDSSKLPVTPTARDSMIRGYGVRPR